MKQKITILLLIFLFTFCGKSAFAYSGEIVESFDTPGNYPTGLTFDGKYLWLADRKEKLLFCINPKSGKVIRSIQSPGYWPTGLAWDGQYLWNADVKGGIPLSENYKGKVYQVDSKNGNIIRTVNAPSNSPRGLCWDGKYLWEVDNATDVLRSFSPNDGTTIKSFKAPAYDSQGLTFDGKYLWVTDRSNDEIYMIDPSNGHVILITKAPGKFIKGITYDGEFLWVVDHQSKKLYKIIAKDDDKLIRYNEHEANVTYTHQLSNFGPGKLLTTDIYLAIPVNRDNQNLQTDIIYSPQYTDIVEDQWGQKTAHYHFNNLEQGISKTVEMKIKVKTYDVRYFVFPDKVGSLSSIPTEIKNRYLVNDEKYQINNPFIQSSLAKAIGNEENPYWKARKIFDYIIDNMYYEMTGGWNTAPTVLKRGNGSCSEYSFVYISMCRAAGIPARYVGAVAIGGEDYSMDDVFHRWVEIYLPNYGWIPVDPAGGDNPWPRNQANRFGGISASYLVTTQSGGGSKTMEWTYNSNQFWTSEAKCNVVFDYFADWDNIK